MAITHPVNVRTDLADTIQGLIGGAGKCVLRAGGAEVSTMILNTPSFNAAVAGTIDLNLTPSVPEDASATGNVAAVDQVDFTNSADAVIFSGDNITGIGGGGDLELSKSIIDPGDTVQLTSYSYSASP